LEFLFLTVPLKGRTGMAGIMDRDPETWMADLFIFGKTG
jgi:hypothetical protein